MTTESGRLRNIAGAIVLASLAVFTLAACTRQNGADNSDTVVVTARPGPTPTAPQFPTESPTSLAGPTPTTTVVSSPTPTLIAVAPVHGYQAQVWAKTFADEAAHPGGWQFGLSVPRDRAGETDSARVTWPDGTTTTELDPDFAPGLHPRESAFGTSTNSRFVKFGDDLGWPPAGPYRFEVVRNGGETVELTVDYRGRRLSRLESVAVTFAASDSARLEFDLPPQVQNWIALPVTAEGRRIITGSRQQTTDGSRAILTLSGVRDWSAIAGFLVAVADPQNVLEETVPLPSR